MKRITTFLLAATLCTGMQAQTANYNVAPLPKTIKAVEKSDYLLNAETRIVCTQPDGDLMRDAMFLQEYIQDLTGLCPAILTGDKKEAKGNIWLVVDQKNVPAKEGYRISISDKGVVISGQTAAGIFYGIQTLRKSLPIVKQKDGKAVVTVTIDVAGRDHLRGVISRLSDINGLEEIKRL